MMNILIVDDEYVTRLGLKTCLSKVKDFHIVGECSNGKQALEMVNKHHQIDVILLDLNMPLMDGLQFLSSLSPGFRGKVVVLSGYDDLEHIKEAMKLGACDYFHKPTMTPQKIIKMITEIQEKMGEEEQYSVTHDTVDWIQQLIEYPTNDLLDRCLKWFAFKPKFLYTALLSINDFHQQSSSFEMKKCLLEWRNGETLQSEFLSWDEDKVLMVDFLETNSALYSKEKMWQRAQEIQLRLRRQLKVTVSIGLSEVKSSPLELRGCVLQSEQALEQEFFLGREKVLFFPHGASKTKPLVDEASTTPIWQAFETLDKQEVQREIEAYFKTVQSRHNRKEIQVLCIQLLSELRKSLQDQGADMYSDRINIEKAFSVHYAEDLTAHIVEAFHQGIDLLSEHNNQLYSPYVRIARQYIQAHLVEEITLDDLAQLSQSNPSYLSRMFKQQTGTTIKEYITRLRIEKAKALLLQGQLRINEVAFSVGYQNERYFTQVFKEESGSTPSEYKKLRKVKLAEQK